MNDLHSMSLEEAELYAAQAGVILTPRDREQIAELQAGERARAQAEPTASRGWVERFNHSYPKFLELLIGIGEVLLTLTQTVIVAFGVPFTLVLLLIVEQQRVVHGISLFELDAALASFAATALVLLNLALEFLAHYIEQRAGYVAERANRWSLRIWAQNMAYTLGLSKDWTAIELSPAQRYQSLLRLVTFSILALALAGSMHSVIEQQSGAWHVAIISIVTNSDLSAMITWLGGLLFAAAAVLSAQGLSRYVAHRCVEIVAGMKAQQVVSVEQAASDRAAVQYIVGRVAQQQLKAEAKGKAAAPAVPLAVPVFSSNGNGNH